MSAPSRWDIVAQNLYPPVRVMARPQFAAGDFVAAGAGNFVYLLIRPATDEAQRSFGGIAGFDTNFFWLADVVFDSNVSSPSIDTPSHNGDSGRAFLEHQPIVIDELHVWRFGAVALGTLWSRIDGLRRACQAAWQPDNKDASDATG